MKKINSFIVLLIVICSMSVVSLANISDPKPLGEILSSSKLMFEGFVIKAEFSKCGAEANLKYVYTIQKTKVWKGSVEAGEVRICGIGGKLLLGQKYFVAGSASNKEFVEYMPEGIYLIFPGDRYFRPITYDTPIITTQSSKAYAVAFEDTQFLEVLNAYLEKRSKGNDQKGAEGNRAQGQKGVGVERPGFFGQAT